MEKYSAPRYMPPSSIVLWCIVVRKNTLIVIKATKRSWKTVHCK
jgi:hypothetical protein